MHHIMSQCSLAFKNLLDWWRYFGFIKSKLQESCMIGVIIIKKIKIKNASNIQNTPTKVWAKLVGHTFNQKLGFKLSILHPFVNGLVPKKT